MKQKKRSSHTSVDRVRPLKVDAQNRAPLYHQLFLILRSQIYDGEYPEGTYLPSEHDLVEKYEVSRITAVRALNELAATNLVIRSRGLGTRVNFAGKGTVIRGPSHSERPGSAAISSVVDGKVETFLDGLRQRYEALSSAQLLRFVYEKASDEIRTALQLNDNEIVQCAVRVWSTENIPFGHLTTHVPADIGQKWDADAVQQASLVELLDGAGETIGRVNETVTATLADAALANWLHVSVGSPLLKLTRMMYNQQGQPIGHLTGLYPPERYQYLVSLTREQLSAVPSRIHIKNHK